jgi:glycosidase
VGVPPRDVLVNFIDNHDIPRFRYERPAIEALHNALFFLFTWDGIPSLYYGTEQELDGGNDPANREDLWASRHGAYDTTNATFRRIAALTRLRRAYPALRRGEVTIRWSSERTGGERDAGVFAFERTVAGERVLVVLNVHDGHESETRAPDEHGAGAMVTGFPAGTVLIDVATDAAGGERFTVEGGGRLVVRVPARGGRVLVPEGQVR